jgi:hypothetical protein
VTLFFIFPAEESLVDCVKDFIASDNLFMCVPAVVSAKEMTDRTYLRCLNQGVGSDFITLKE